MKKVEEHSFSVEMKSQSSIRRMSFLDKENANVLFEGFLGELKEISLVEGLMLQIEGSNGVLRVDITQEDLKGCLEVEKAVALGGERHE
ncbi:MAG: hypothetical protein ABSF44_14520 [Candidatus Bathyarchaeia archaeon]|jgi:hypothetical protein